VKRQKKKKENKNWSLGHYIKHNYIGTRERESKQMDKSAREGDCKFELFFFCV
jgi:hypothetical protein